MSTTRTTGVVDGDTERAVRELAEAASRVDGASSLSEDALLRLRTGGGEVTHVLHREGSDLAGYAQLVCALDRTRPYVLGRQLEGELLVAPAWRRRGLGAALLSEVSALADDVPTLLWSHGDTPGALALATSAGWTRARELLRLDRAMAGLDALDEPDLPAGVVVRPFVGDVDDEAWVALNAAAFAGHPEQGRWRLEDLLVRRREPWFDQAVFLLAELDGELLGFCWMKVEEHLAELYVLGVAPGRGGRGLGRALLVRGLHAVAAQPAAPARVELYVDGDNAAALRLYTKLGFERAAVDVQYRSPDPT
ncbi:MAG: mycothiol synthase [Janthinobacterium lividum]